MSSPSEKTTTLRIALDWTPNTIHTGLYVALAHSYYAAAHLSVELLPPDLAYTRTPAQRLRAGDADLAVCPSESCIAYNESAVAAAAGTGSEGGKPLRLQAIYALLQRDASAIASATVDRPAQLAGKRYGSYNARYEDAIVRAMVAQDGGAVGGGEVVGIVRDEGKFGLWEAVKNGKLDATWVFVPWEGAEVEEEGEKVKMFRPEDFGVPYGYSPVLARDRDRSPSEEVLKAFVRATRKGYEFAVQNPEAAAEILAPFCEPKRSGEFLVKSQKSINGFYGDGKSPLGAMEAEKWEKWLGWLSEKQLLSAPEKLKMEDVFDTSFAA